MDIRQIQYFVRVVELGSFSRASVVLGVAQPALSRHVRLLEVELRQNLLLRNGRGVTLTEAGKVLIEHCRGILHQIDRAREDLGRIGTHLSGHVSVGIPPSLARLLVVPLTRAMRARMPDATLSVREGLSLHMQESLVAGRLDIALLYNVPPGVDLDVRPLCEEELFVVSPRGVASRPLPPGPLCPHELAELPLVIPGRPHAIRMVVEAVLGNAGLKPRVSLEIEGIPTILDLVREHAGHAILPISAVATSGHAHAFETRQVASRQLVTRLAIATPARRAATHTQKAVLDMLVELARTQLGIATSPQVSGIASSAQPA